MFLCRINETEHGLNELKTPQAFYKRTKKILKRKGGNM
jgi:hypothetical protein